MSKENLPSSHYVQKKGVVFASVVGGAVGMELGFKVGGSITAAVGFAAGGVMSGALFYGPELIEHWRYKLRNRPRLIFQGRQRGIRESQ